jgi:hypothetical protein
MSLSSWPLTSFASSVLLEPLVGIRSGGPEIGLLIDRDLHDELLRDTVCRPAGLPALDSCPNIYVVFHK